MGEGLHIAMLLLAKSVTHVRLSNVTYHILHFQIMQMQNNYWMHFPV